MIDSHTHCSFSADSSTPPIEILDQALRQGLSYLAITDHCDHDYLFARDKAHSEIPQLDIATQFSTLSALKERYSSKIKLGVGIELGYVREAEDYYKEILSKFSYDIVLNSIHLIEYDNCYFPNFYDNRTQKEANTAYLKAVLESVNANYSYDVITHLGYISRKAPFEDNRLYYRDYAELFDQILIAIIERGVCLEINTHARGTGGDFLPQIDILSRYKQLGGEFLTFGSDAHQTYRLAEKFDIVCQAVKELGFKYFTTFDERNKTLYKI